MAGQVEDSLVESINELLIVQSSEAERPITASPTLDEVPTHSCQYCATVLKKADNDDAPWYPLSSSGSTSPDLAWSSCIVFVSCLSILVKEDHIHLSSLVDAWHGSQSHSSRVKTRAHAMSSVVATISQDPRYHDAELQLQFEHYEILYIHWQRRDDPSRHMELSTASIGDLGVYGEIMPTKSDPRSAESFLQIRTWLNECKLYHTRCRSREQERGLMSPPSRILKIHQSTGETPSHLSLKVMPTQTSYVALSYCWGQDQSSFFTTLSNFESRQAGFTYAGLPKTIKDAIDVCVELGYTYLWIDALCIVQDDVDQMQSELALMADIYGGADLVLSAACAGASSEGFLQMRLPSIILQWEDRRMIFNVHDILGKTALSRRAWTLQEHRQAQRLLQYQRYSTDWYCTEKMLVDGGTEAACDGTHNYPSFLKIDGFTNESPPGSSSTAIDEWLEIVEAYSTRQISMATDRLPALSAVAREFAQKLNLDGSAYKAGIWFTSKRRDWSRLLWYRRGGESCQRNSREDATLPLPSWSWSSCGYAIHHSFESRMEMTDQNSLQIEVDLRDPSFAYGEVLGGRLTLRGPVRRITRMTPEEPDHGEIDDTDVIWLTENANKIKLYMYWDRPDLSSSKVAWLLPFGEGGADIVGLVLANQPGGHFARLGIFEYSGDINSDETPQQKWLRDVPLTTITIH